MFGIGGSELIGIALIALLLFGPTKLPELARSLAKGYREFLKFRQQMNNAVDELRSDIEFDLDDEAAQKKLPQIRPPAGSRVSAAGDDYLAADDPVPELIELEVPPEDDYLAAGGGQ